MLTQNLKAQKRAMLLKKKREAEAEMEEQESAQELEDEEFDDQFYRKSK